MSKITLINGLIGAHLDPADRGFAYGDGLFETILTLNGRPVYWHMHLERLTSSCQRLGISTHGLAAELEQDIKKLKADLSEFGQTSGVLKVTVTRGQGQRGYAFDSNVTRTRIVAWSLYQRDEMKPVQGVEVRFCNTTLGKNSLLAGMKHLNRLEQVLARAEWSDPQISEGLVLDVDGRLAEGTMSNLFWVEQGVLFTPALAQCGVHGVMRTRIMELAQHTRIEVNMVDCPPSVLKTADEIFLANSVIGIWPVVKLADQSYPVGPVTRQFQVLVEKDEM